MRWALRIQGTAVHPPVLPGASPALSVVTTQAHSCASHLSRVVYQQLGYERGRRDPRKTSGRRWRC